MGCYTEPPETGTPVRVYALAEPDGRLALADYMPSCPEGGVLWEFALEQVLLGGGGRSPFPPGVTVTESALEGGVATVTLSEEAASLTGFALTLARACVVLTLTGLDGIDGVTLLIEGQISEPAVLRASDFLVDSLVLEDTERVIMLYFADQTGEQAILDTRTLIVRETDTLVWYLDFMLKELIAGPKKAGLRPVLPEGTRLLSVLVEGGVCTVNFSHEFVSGGENGGVSRRMTLYCLVRSVTAQPGVSSLKLLVDGQPLEVYGTIDTSEPLTMSDVRGD
jgi:germination protein M